MADGVSARQLAKVLGVTEGAVRKALKANRIKRLPNGLIDPEAVREAWQGSTDPARTKVRTEPQTVRTRGTHPRAEVRTPAEAREAVSLIARVLAEEGVEDADGGIDFGKARTAELILKARQRSLDQAEQQGRLIERTAAEAAFFDAARENRDAWLAWPARIAIEAADEIQVDPRTGKVDSRSLVAVLDAQVRRHLAEMGEAELPHWRSV
ncbi:hypothetical protein [Methylobacterium nodulans]|uniref:Uncharacterized protein n=1 Tax=Methylobacterium nodulans (strain LMG 21967 / CNCM I-2342 / ORS 2060) TaxID=460265 RepID=B8ICN6_METNO|nr:hypothetical protein [Methylobacterium nodulans]ACL57447.1 conserved hypothetical protein [Methylobacterium nodulans ORS 2060]